MTQTSDTRYVTLAAAEITPTPRPGIWVRGERISQGQKTLVIFCSDPRGGSPVRFYPLDPNEKVPPAFRVAYSPPPADAHTVIDQDGVCVYVDIASRRRRIEYQLARLRPTFFSDYLEALIDIDHLIFHELLHDPQKLAAIEKDYDRMTKLKLHALGTPYPEERLTAIQLALRIAKRIGGITNDHDS